MTTSINPVTVEDLLSNAAWARRLALNLASDRDSADDLVQETSIATLRARPDASPSLRPWLARVLRNRASTHRRDDARRAARHDRAAGPADAAAADPEALLGRMQVQRVLAELITSLDEPGRQTVLLRYYEGLTSERIGALMGVAPGTVRRRLKEAIDKLRDALDRRHQGNRDTWLRALLPLGVQLEPDGPEPSPAASAPVSTAPTAAPARSHPGSSARTSRPRLPAGVSLPRLVAGALAVSLAGGGLLLATSLQSQPPDGTGAAPAPGGSGRAGGLWMAAALPATFEACQQALAALRKELAPAEAIYRNRAPRDVLFEDGSPNPTARAALLPEIERLMRGDAGAGLGFSLECRTWACRMLVLRPGRASEGENARSLMTDFWSHIPHDPDIQQRIRGWWWLPERWIRDPVSGVSYQEAPVYLALKKPSGAPVAGLPPAVDPSSDDARPEPRTLQACQSELQAAGERLAYVRRVNEDRMSLTERFRESEFAPALTLDIRVQAIRVLQAAGERRAPDVLCRGEVCRVSVPGRTTSDPWRHQLVRDPAFSSRIRETAVSPEALILAIHPSGPGRENRTTTILQLGKDILQAADLPACATRSPGEAGLLVIKLVFPNTRQPPPPGAPPPAITVRLTGPLAGTPLAGCVEQAVTRQAGAATPPADLAGGSVQFQRTFPLDANLAK